MKSIMILPLLLVLFAGCFRQATYLGASGKILTINGEPFIGSKETWFKLLGCECKQPTTDKQVMVLERTYWSAGKKVLGYAIFVQKQKPNRSIWKQIDFFPYEERYRVTSLTRTTADSIQIELEKVEEKISVKIHYQLTDGIWKRVS